MAKLRERDALSARALEFTILTAARSGETLGATWGEIDFNANTWTIPASRMKSGKEHVVPLSSSTVKLLESLRPNDSRPDDRIFAVRGTPRSNMAMSALLKRMDHGHITTHGFRSTFRDWAGDETDYPRELAEQALAHDIGNKAERAYRRGKAIEKRRELMEAWAQILSGSYVRRADFDPHSSTILYQPAA
jgi:integrase